MKRCLALSGALHVLLLGAMVLWGMERMDGSAARVIQVLLVQGHGSRPVRGAAERPRIGPPPRVVPSVTRRPIHVARRSLAPPGKNAEAHPSPAPRAPVIEAGPAPAGTADGKNTAASAWGTGSGVSPSPAQGEGEPGGTERDRRIAVIRDRIQRALVYPREARRRGRQGTSEVQFDLSEDGRVRTLALAESSGEELLDRASLETVRRAQPFPFVDGTLVVPVVFRLSDAH
jgi:protein TonB